MSATCEGSVAPEATVRRPRVLPVVVAVLAAYLVFCGVRLAVFDGSASGFITAGDGITDVTAAPDGLYVSPDVDGYDGQAYYRLARSPLTDEISDLGIAFTRPAYWQTRIGYPVTVWTVSLGGQPALVPAMMLLVNLLSVAVIALLASRLARDLGRSPWWGALPAMWAGFLVGVGQDLTEPLAGALLLAALIALRRDHPMLAATALTAAALTRETTLLVALAVLLASLVMRYGDRDRRRGVTAPAWWIGAVPIALYAVWRAWVRSRWDEMDTGTDAGGDNVLREPFGALLGYLGRAWDVPGPEWANLVLLVPTLAALGIAAIALARRDALLHERLALAGYLALLACLPVWDRGQAYLRWGCEPMLLTWLVLIGHRALPATASPPSGSNETPRPLPRALPALAVLTVLLWALTATQSVGYPRTDGAWNGLWTWS